MKFLDVAFLLQTPITGGEEVYRSDFIRSLGLTLAYLLVVCLLVVVVVKLLSWQKGIVPRKAATPLIKQLAKMELAPQRSIYLIKAGEKFLLLGGSESGLSLITDLKREELPEKLEEPETGFSQPVMYGFQYVMQNLGRSFKKPGKKG